MLELKDVSVGFGDALPALAEVSLKIEEGDRLLVCGAAGSAKTTMLSVAAGIMPRLVPVQRFSGVVELDGRPLASIPSDTLFTSICSVAQNVEDQLWDLGVEDLIAFPLENRGAQRVSIRERVRHLLDLFRLDALRGRRVLSLSGGERRLVAIAAAISAMPRLLVLDEPTTGLDPDARKRLVGVLRDLGSDLPGILVAEQDAAAFAPIARHVHLLVSGRLSSRHDTATILASETPWFQAGILPPKRRFTRRPAPAEGQELLRVAAVRTALRRADGRPVLDGAGLSIRAGEVVALVGRNGAGKTTLFQAILGLARIEAGEIAIGGDDAKDWTVARRARSIAYLPQNMRRILFNMSVLDEVAFAITAGGPRDGSTQQRAQEALARYGLGALSEANPFSLSARQQALLGLACADAAQARIAILDEPLLARDVEGRRMLDLFVSSMVTTGRAVMLISHDLALVDEISTRVLVLEGGRIAHDGPTADAWDSSAFRALGWDAPLVAAERPAA